MHWRMAFILVLLLGSTIPVLAQTNAPALADIKIKADKGDRRAQADLADILLQGKLAKQDLIEAYKWGELATHGATNDPAAKAGSVTRDAAILKMSPAQITEGKKRVAAFVPHTAKPEEAPDPAWEGQVKLTGLSGAHDQRLAILNGKTFARGEKGEVKANGKVIQVHCLEIRENSVVVEVEGYKKPIEIIFSGK